MQKMRKRKKIAQAAGTKESGSRAGGSFGFSGGKRPGGGRLYQGPEDALTAAEADRYGFVKRNEQNDNTVGRKGAIYRASLIFSIMKS